MATFADLILTNGVVHTMDDASPSAAAIAVDDGVILFVGSDEGARAFVGEGTEVVELGGKTVLPGLIDAHTHLVTSGSEAQDAALGGCADVDCLLAVIREHAASRPAGWVLGGGYDVSAFEGHLTRQMLDAVVPDRPVYMGAVDGHSAWVNCRLRSRRS